MKTVSYLLSSGADAGVRDKKGQSPAFLARRLALQTDSTAHRFEIWRVLQNPPLQEGPSCPSALPTQRQNKVATFLPSSAEQEYACDTFQAVVAMISTVSRLGCERSEVRSVGRRTITDLLYEPRTDLIVESKNHAYRLSQWSTAHSQISWYHIPSNNVSTFEFKHVLNHTDRALLARLGEGSYVQPMCSEAVLNSISVFSNNSSLKMN